MTFREFYETLSPQQPFQIRGATGGESYSEVLYDSRKPRESRWELDAFMDIRVAKVRISPNKTVRVYLKNLPIQFISDPEWGDEDFDTLGDIFYDIEGGIILVVSVPKAPEDTAFVVTSKDVMQNFMHRRVAQVGKLFDGTTLICIHGA